MRIWSSLLIKSDWKWCIHLSRSLFWYIYISFAIFFHFMFETKYKAVFFQTFMPLQKYISILWWHSIGWIKMRIRYVTNVTLMIRSVKSKWKITFFNPCITKVSGNLDRGEGMKLNESITRIFKSYKWILNIFLPLNITSGFKNLSLLNTWSSKKYPSYVFVLCAIEV